MGSLKHDPLDIAPNSQIHGLELSWAQVSRGTTSESNAEPIMVGLAHGL